MRSSALPLLLVTIAGAAAAKAVGVAVCPAAYDAGGDLSPLLFGGVQDRCSSGCQARGNAWCVANSISIRLACLVHVSAALDTRPDAHPWLPGAKHMRMLCCRSRACVYDAATPTWGLCLPEQRAQLRAFLQQEVADGRADPSMLTFSPCELFNVLAAGGGRTLWLVGCVCLSLQCLHF